MVWNDKNGNPMTRLNPIDVELRLVQSIQRVAMIRQGMSAYGTLCSVPRATKAILRLGVLEFMKQRSVNEFLSRTETPEETNERTPEWVRLALAQDSAEDDSAHEAPSPANSTD